MSDTAVRQPASRLPHRYAIALAALTFPLLWIGQLITTTDAGMAVPDWPGTYGYNMFLYPWETWFFGPWDLFIEHGHRLLASLVGLVTIATLVVTWWRDDRAWLRWLMVAALALVILQGALGGARVLLNERLVGMLHGSTGPAFFALTCVLVVLSRPTGASPKLASARLAKLTSIAAGLAFLQLVAGASLRHIDAAVDPWAFAALVKVHLTMAVAVALAALVVALAAVGLGGWPRVVALVLGFAALAQPALGGGTWLLKYGAPGWASDWLPATMGATTAGGWNQVHIVNAHSAVGSLMVGLLAALAAYAWRSRAVASVNDFPSEPSPAAA